jgi:hypothetical protein
MANLGDATALIDGMLNQSGLVAAAELRWPRNPKAVGLVDSLGTLQQTLYPQGDGVQFDYGASDLVNVRVGF